MHKYVSFCLFFIFLSSCNSKVKESRSNLERIVNQNNQILSNLVLSSSIEKNLTPSNFIDFYSEYITNLNNQRIEVASLYIPKNHISFYNNLNSLIETEIIFFNLRQDFLSYLFDANLLDEQLNQLTEQTADNIGNYWFEIELVSALFRASEIDAEKKELLNKIISLVSEYESIVNRIASLTYQINTLTDDIVVTSEAVLYTGIEGDIVAEVIDAIKGSRHSD
ncbi:MAG: hypothetical protein HN691_02485 [Bacteroidetes bacterium]|nr:hypothetical protein [Bacteroidota bacterium]